MQDRANQIPLAALVAEDLAPTYYYNGPASGVGFGTARGWFHHQYVERSVGGPPITACAWGDTLSPHQHMRI